MKDAVDTLVKLFGLRRILVAAAFTFVLDAGLTYWNPNAQLERAQIIFVFSVTLIVEQLIFGKGAQSPKENK